MKFEFYDYWRICIIVSLLVGLIIGFIKDYDISPFLTAGTGAAMGYLIIDSVEKFVIRSKEE